MKGFSAKKRGQITTIMIIGLVVLIVASMIGYIVFTASTQKSRQAAEEETAPGILPPIDVYIGRCIDKESQPAVLRLAEQGGAMAPAEGKYAYYNTTPVSYLCMMEGPGLKYSCRNSFLTRQEMQRALAREIAGRLKECIDLKPFEAQGYRIQAGEITSDSVKVEIGRKDIVVHLIYPINLTKAGENTQKKDFQSTVNLPLGELYELAMDIVNSEIMNSYFDIDNWMFLHGASVIIEKHRPYPDTIYILKEKTQRGDMEFRFALQDNPSIGQPRPKQKPLYGSCTNGYDNLCLNNVQEAYCRQVKGSYNPSKTYACPANSKIAVSGKNECDGNACMDCQYDAYGKRLKTPKKNGESWCVYDSITGKGFDYVGSRHYKQSCINGNVYVEECRDYREELCTDDGSHEVPKAECRMNRWADCINCDTEECCNDLRQRDCFWNSELTTSRKCVPYVPPGLRFWDNEGNDVCLRANEKNDCDGFSCPNIWVDSAAVFCYSQGDCGNYRNTADVITYNGFYQTDPAYRVRSYVYFKDGWNRNPLPDGSFWSINLPNDKREQHLLINSAATQTPVGNLPLLISAGFNFIDEIVRLDFTDFLNPFAPMPRMHIVDFSLCSLWSAPTKRSLCVLCSADPTKPCSEYKCKSLGQLCQFSMEKGVPKCELPSLTDKEPPVINLNKGALTKGYEAMPAKLLDFKGYKIEPKIAPHKPFTFGINTSEPTRCRLRLSPKMQFFSLPSFWFNDAAFKTEHNVTIRMPPMLVVPQKLLDFLNFTSASGFMTFLDNLNSIYEGYKQKLSNKFAIYRLVTGDDLIAKIDPPVKNAISYISGMAPIVKEVVRALIIQFDKGGYYIFAECTDMAGNDNDQQFFVQFEVDKDYIDNEPPVIVYADPANNSKVSPEKGVMDLFIYVDEPAECRYSLADRDFDSMDKSFSCDTGYSISPVAGGTYECKALIAPKTENKLYIRCKDNPPDMESYMLKVSKGSQVSVRGFEGYNYSGMNITLDMYAKASEPNIIEAPAKMLSDLSFTVMSTPIKLRLYLPDNRKCRYSNHSAAFEQMNGMFGQCRPMQEIEKGLYECDATLEPNEGMENALGNYTLSVNVAGNAKSIEESSAVKTIDVRESRIGLGFGDSLYGSGIASMNSSSLIIELNTTGTNICTAAKNNQTAEQMSCIGENRTRCTITESLGENSTFIFMCSKTNASLQYEFYISCADVNMTKRNVNDRSYVYAISEGQPLNISISPSGIITEKEFNLVVTTSSGISDSEIRCGYNDNPYYGMLNMDRIAGDRFGVLIMGLEPGKKYRYYVQCHDKYGNDASGYTEIETVV